MSDSSRQSIAMLTDDFVPAGTGVGVHVQKMSKEIVARGQQVTVITTRRRGQPAEEMWNGVKVYRVFSIPVYKFYQALPSPWTLRKIFLQNSVSVVHCHYLGIMMLRAIKVADQMGIPKVLTTHMTVDHLTQPIFMKPLRPLLSKMIARIYEKFQEIICVSVEYARQVERFNIGSRIHYISNPVDFDSIEACEPNTSGVFRIFFAGRLAQEKNVSLLLNAFKILSDKAPAELTIAGKGQIEAQLYNLSVTLGLKDKVKFLGHVEHNQLPALYAACDVFVLPSLVETQGLVALEAMMYKRPVIVTSAIISAKELVDHEQNGFIVDPHNPQDLADRLELLRKDPELRRRQGESGFKKASSQTVPAVADALNAVYHAVSGGPAPRFDVTDHAIDKRERCVLCQIGTFAGRAEHVVVGSNARCFQEEYFAVWRCAFCRSIHSLPKFSLEKYYQRSPFLQRSLNRFNRVAFEDFYHWLIKRGIGPDTHVLFYGVNSAMFQDFFRSKGYRHFDKFEEVLTEDRLKAQPPGTYEAIIVLDYLERTEEPRMIFEFAAKQLVPGGKLIIHTPDAEKIKIPLAKAHELHQPFRLHIVSQTTLEALAENQGFHKKSLERHHYLDTWTPFINCRAFFDLAYFGDGTLEAAFEFKPRDILKKFWRIPKFLFFGFLGRLFPDRFNLLAIFEKTPATIKAF